MDKKLKETKKIYDDIKVPEELEFLIRKTINDDKLLKKKIRENKNMRYKKIATSAAAVAIVFVGSINMNSSVAMAMYNVPVIGEIAKIVTFREYKYDTNIIDVDVKVPNIENTGNKELEDRINKEINSRLEEAIAEGEKYAEDYKKAVLETGGSEEDVHQVGVFADYEVKYSDENILSFIINKGISTASFSGEALVYNINIKTGEELKISDVLGENYKSIVDESVKKQIEERSKSDENQIFFGNEEDREMGIEGFTGIDESQKFFINDKGIVVVKFEKYEIAPGYMGMPEFEVAEINISNK